MSVTNTASLKHSRGILTSQQVQLTLKGQANTEAFRSLEKEINDLNERIAQMERLEGFQARAAADGAPARIASQVESATRQAVTTTLSAMLPTPGDTAESRKAKLNEAYRNHYRTGKLFTAETRDVLTSNGVALVPQEFDRAYVQASKVFAPLATAVHRIVSTRPFKTSVIDTTSINMSLPGEGSSTSETDPSVFSKVAVESDSLTAQLIVSHEFFDDVAWSLETAVRDWFGPVVSRAQSNAILLGTTQGAVSLPNMNGGLIAATTSASTTSSIASAIGWQDLVNTFSGVNYSYAVRGSWVLNPATFKYLLGLKDSIGRPYMVPDPQTGFFTILGRPVLQDYAMPLYTTANAKALLFGDLSKAWTITDGGIATVVQYERYADQNNVGILLYNRLSGNPLVSAAVAALQIASV
jgi:HK97 family phage major capsid protein